jgi:catechol-2,3-dioxygenase
VIGRLDHVVLGVADLDEAATRWARQFGLTERARSADRVDLACDDEAVALALVPGAPGFDSVAWRLRHDVSLDDAAGRLDAHGVAYERDGDALATRDVEGNAITILAYAAPASRLVAHARPAGDLRPGHPRKLGHVNFLTARIDEQAEFYSGVLGMGLTDWLGDGGVWLHIGAEHHVMALVDKGAAHFHHLALDVVDIGQMRDALDHLGRHPRKLGHVNFRPARIQEQVAFYRDVLGMGMTDWLGDGGAWLHVDGDHHAMALVKAVPPARSHLHHIAFDVVDIGQMRDHLDHLGRHGRWLGWGPTRHGVGGNIASYVRITEEPLFVELYCDMERLAPDHEVRTYPDDRSSSNTWGPLPPRSYFRFDDVAVNSERESLEMLGHPLPDPVEAHA